MAFRRGMKVSLMIAAVIAAATAVQAAVQSIEPIAVSTSAGRDPVPGRDPEADFCFRGESDVKAPVINESGEVVFRAKSSSSSSSSANTAYGIYVRRPGEPLAVLVDTTVNSSGAPVFQVPGRSSAAKFINFGAPLLNNAGDVVFSGQFSDTVGGSGFGMYSVSTTGGTIHKLADTSDVAPDGGGATFSTFTFSATKYNGLTLGALNDNGDVVLWAYFNGTTSHGLYGTTVSGGTLVRLADNTNTVEPTNVPDGSGAFRDLRPEFVLDNNGNLVFRGSIGASLKQGIFTVSADGGIPRAVAFRSDPAPPDGSVYFTTFTVQDVTDSGALLFVGGLSNGAHGLFAGDLSTNAASVVVDTRGGFSVPNEDPAAGFYSIAEGTMNEAGKVAFYSLLINASTVNNAGIYSASISEPGLGLVIDKTPPAPGLAPPSQVTNVFSTSAAVNDYGHMTFWGQGKTETAATLYGLYFFDACTETTERITDSTTSATDLNASFSTGGFGVFRGELAGAGKFRSINNSNQVAFLAQFNNFDFGIYMANMEAGSGGTEISCPVDAVLECPADTSPDGVGYATAVDGCSGASAPVTFTDVTTSGCGGTVDIVRTWSVDDGSAEPDTCVQQIDTVDTTAPTLVVDTTPVTLRDTDCSGAEAVALPAATATDDCDDEVTVENDAPATLPVGETATVTFTATDDCGNAATAQLDVTVENGADIAVVARKYSVGIGSHPLTTDAPLAGITVGAYDLSPGSCADGQLPGNDALPPSALPGLVANCTPIATGVTDANGVAYLNVPPGDYVVASRFDCDGDGTSDDYLGQLSSVNCGEVETTHLLMMEVVSGKKLMCKNRRLTGSELLIVEPAEIVWDGTEQFYPFVFASAGDWDVTVSVAPPDGFVADYDELSEYVESQTKSVQFTITEVGSDLVPTETRFDVVHKGRRRIIESNIGIRLTPQYARERGFDVAELRQKGLIYAPKEVEVGLQPVQDVNRLDH